MHRDFWVYHASPSSEYDPVVARSKLEDFRAEVDMWERDGFEVSEYTHYVNIIQLLLDGEEGKPRKGETPSPGPAIIHSDAGHVRAAFA